VDTPPPTQQPPPYQYPPTNQSPYQYDPSSLNQFGYPQNQGPGPYGWNPGYGGSPFDYSNSNPYSNFSNAIMQGMGVGMGKAQETPPRAAKAHPLTLLRIAYGGMGGVMDQLMGYTAGRPYGRSADDGY
jgi:hypothetical protein